MKMKNFVKKIGRHSISLMLVVTMLGTTALNTTLVGANSRTDDTDSGIVVSDDGSKSDAVANLILDNWKELQNHNAGIKVENGLSDNATDVPEGSDTKDSGDDIVVDKSPGDSSDISVDGDMGDVSVEDVEDVGGSDVSDAIKEPDVPVTELLVKTDDESVIKKEDVVSSYDDTYLLAYDTEKDAADAYDYYDGVVSDGFVARNNNFVMATGADDVVVEPSGGTLALDSLQSALSERNSIKGKNVIALIDTGVGKDASVVDAVSMFGEDPWDENGHGSYLLELMQDVHPDVDVLSIKALDSHGCGSVSTVYAAIEYAIAQKVSVINLSLCGRRIDENLAIETAIQHALDEGIVVVAAAGNYNADVKDFVPANMKDIYVIGAADSDGWKSSVSNFGKTVDYNVVANSTSEAAAKFSAYVAKSNCDVKSLDTKKDAEDGWLFSTDYALNSTGPSVDTGDLPEGFAAQWRFAKDGLGSVDGFRYRINNIDFSASSDNIKNPFSLDFFENVRLAGYTSSEDRWFLTCKKNFAAGETFRTTVGMEVVRFDFEDAVKSWDGREYMLRMSISNVEIYTPMACKNVSLINAKDGRTSQIGAATYIDPKDNKVFTEHADIGLRFTVTMKLIDAETGAPASGRCVYGFKDLDQPGSDGSYGRTNYTEGVELSEGFHGPLHTKSNTKLKIDGDWIYGTEDTEDGKDSAFTCTVTAAEWRFRWSGFDCGTNLLYAPSTGDGFTKYTITPTSVGPGSISPNSVQNVFSGGSQSFRMTPNAHAYIKSVSVDDVGQLAYMGATSAQSYSFENVKANHKIHVVFALNKYRQTTYIRHQGVDGTWGAYTAIDARDVEYGSPYSYTWTRNVGTEPLNVYHDANPVTVGTSSVTGVGNYYIDVARKTYVYSFVANPPTKYPLTGNPVAHAASEVANMQSSITGYAQSLSGAVSSPSLTGYVFMGWNTAADGSGAAYVSEQMLSNKTFYAQWKPITYKVRYDDNNESNPNHQTGEFTQNVVTSASGMPDTAFSYDRNTLRGGVQTRQLRANDFVRAGYEFVGWNTKADGSGTSYVDGYNDVFNWSSADGTVITLYAQWRKLLGSYDLFVVSEETGNRVPGVTLDLYKNVNGMWEKLDTQTTNSSGKIHLDNLHWFDYQWRCTGVPAGYEKLANFGFRVDHNNLSQSQTQILYMKHVSIELRSSVSELINGEAAPCFMYHIEGTDAAGVKHSYDVMVQTSKSTKSGKRTQRMFAGTYKVTQIPVSRYRPGTAKNVSHATPDGVNATVDVLNYDSGVVEFPYTLRQYNGFSHTDGVLNDIHAN